MTVVWWVLGGLVVVGFVGWLGFQVMPAPFPAYSETSRQDAAQQVPLPQRLPEPVARFYRGVYGETIPVIHSVVITGRAKIRPAGPLWLPARFRFTHDAGKGYRHYIEATWFGIPVLRVNERYVDGASLMELPWATDSGPKVEQAANLGMWAELSSSAPSVFLTDSRVRWTALDANSATLVVPLGEGGDTDSFLVRFDSSTGALTSMEAMRYRESKSAEKILWTAASEPGPAVEPLGLPAVGSATWADMGTPWAYFTAEDVRYNVDVSSYLRGKGL